MHPITEDIAQVLLNIEDNVITVGKLLDTVSEEEIDAQVPTMDRTLKKSYGAAEATARLLALLRDPDIQPYAPVELIRKISAHHPAAVTRKNVIEAMRQCQGDEEQIAESVRLLVDNVELLDDSSLQCEVATSEGIPRMVFSLEAPANFPDTLKIGQAYTLSLENFGYRWTAASGGGHVAQAEQALILFLEGERDIPFSPVAFNQAAPVSKKLAHSLRSWRGAIGHYEPGYGSGADIIALYRDALGKTSTQLNALREALGLRANNKR